MIRYNLQRMVMGKGVYCLGSYKNSNFSGSQQCTHMEIFAHDLVFGTSTSGMVGLVADYHSDSDHVTIILFRNLNQMSH